MVRLSASRINTVKDCSLKYWYQYILKIPQSPKDYFALGTLVHLILEILLNKKHKSKFDTIVQKEDVYSVPSVKRLIKKHIKKDEELIQKHEEKIKLFILNGLTFDFFCDGCKELLDPEYSFHYRKQNYEVIGFVDKSAIYDNYIRIIDYKTSNYKKDKKDKIFDVQALMYCLVLREKIGVFPKYVVDFMFLKFGKEQQYTCEYENDDLDCFEFYLNNVSSYLNNFTFDKRLDNVAKYGVKKNVFCGALIGDLKVDGSQKHVCEYKYPKTYYAIYKNGEVWKTALNREDLVSYGKEIHEVNHKGCEAWLKEIQ